MAGVGTGIRAIAAVSSSRKFLMKGAISCLEIKPSPFKSISSNIELN